MTEYSPKAPLRLFVSEIDLAAMLGIPLREWKNLAPTYERRGFPVGRFVDRGRSQDRRPLRYPQDGAGLRSGHIGGCPSGG
jgi:hypothetical protein